MAPTVSHAPPEPHKTGEADASAPLAWTVIAVTTIATLPRLTPIGNGDFFSFASVAERLSAGDRLYIDVWDNKDPYFYYLLSLAAGLGGWGYVLLELLWIGVAVAALIALARSQGATPRWALLIGWGIGPWCLLGVTYSGTMSVMPGVALALATLAAAARQRWTTVGVMLGVLVLLKVTLVPVAVAGALVFCVSDRVRAVLATVTGGALATMAGLAVLAVRGELFPFFTMLSRNSEYAARMVDTGGLAGFLDHLALAFPAGLYPGERIALGAIVVGIIVAAVLPRSRPTPLVRCAAVTLALSVVVLGLTAVWPHHAMLLAVPASLTLLALTTATAPRGTLRQGLGVAAYLVAAYLLGGAAPIGQILIKPATAVQPLDQLTGESPEAKSIARDPDVETYARLGRNDRTAHARGLDSLDLMCLNFQQYPFDPDSTFDRTLACLPEADVVFVADNFADQVDAPSYARFAEKARGILARDFTCTPADYGQKCLRSDR